MILDMYSAVITLISRHKPDFLDVLSKSLAIPFSSISFIICTSLSSFPFFTFLFFFNVTLQRYILQIKDSIFLDSYEFFDISLSSNLTQLVLLYILPYHLLQFISIATSVDLATRLHNEEKLGISSLTGSLGKLINKGPLITFVYSVLLSTSVLLGLITIVTNCFSFVGSFNNDDYYKEDFYMYGLLMARNSVVIVAHVAGFIALMVKYMEWSAWWNVSVVVSIIEEEYGLDAFEVSCSYGGRSKKRGGVLMFVFFAWGVGIRVPCLFGGWDVEKGRGERVWFVLLGTALICMGNVMKWVVCCVYFFDCKRGIIEMKKIDHHGRGKEVEQSVVV